MLDKCFSISNIVTEVDVTRQTYSFVLFWYRLI